VLVTLIFCVL